MSETLGYSKRKSYICIARIRHASRRTAYQGGTFLFINPDLAIDKHKYAENLSSLDRELQRSKDDFVKEHYVKYGKENFPPARFL